jgi:hypothetical protein
LPTYRVNQLNTKTKSWSTAGSVIANSFLEAVSQVLQSFAGMRVRRSKTGFTVKEAGVKVIVTEDQSAVTGK